nr:MAG TPA: hypothetical protein [Caudoviricetes sp.]
MTETYTYDNWVDSFKPIANHFRNPNHDPVYAFETYGEEVEFVKAQDENRIWTEVDNDGELSIVSGWHFVNRFQYYITENPFDDNIEVRGL